MSKRLRNAVHFFYAFLGAIRYGFPSRKLFVIGITGTSGKSTTTTLLRQTLEDAGFRVGSLSTVDFYIAGQRKLNDKKMTMLGKMQIQQYLRQMVKEKCDIAIVETTSEGRLQHRHRFIAYDTMVLTNLYTEHIESHGSFENYRKAKQDIFAYVGGLRRKRKRSEEQMIKKTAIVREDVSDRDGFTNHGFDQVILFGGASDFAAKDLSVSKEGLRFSIQGHNFFAPMYGGHNAENIVCVAAIARSLGISWEKIIQSAAEFHNIDGRCEFIPEAEQFGFQVIVDYAFEPVALQKLYDVVSLIAPKRIVHVCSATGGGRDKARREPIGRLVGERAQVMYVTDEDPYDEDPIEIMHMVEAGARAVGKKLGVDMFEISDRRVAIETAIANAQQGDLVLITGKGSEQGMCLANRKMIAWDDREIVRGALRKK